MWNYKPPTKTKHKIEEENKILSYSRKPTDIREFVQVKIYSQQKMKKMLKCLDQSSYKDMTCLQANKKFQNLKKISQLDKPQDNHQILSVCNYVIKQKGLINYFQLQLYNRKCFFIEIEQTSASHLCCSSPNHQSNAECNSLIFIDKVKKMIFSFFGEKGSFF